MLSGGGGFVSGSILCLLLVAGYAFYFGGDLRLVEVCHGDFAADVLCE